MSMISGKTELTTASSMLRKYNATSRDKIKSLVSKVQFETHVERKVGTVLDKVETEGDVQQYERFLMLIKEEDYDVSALHLPIITKLFIKIIFYRMTNTYESSESQKVASRV